MYNHAKRPSALVVLSGGQDSTTCLAWAVQNYREVHAITFDYNQRHLREIQAARDVAKICNVRSHEVITLGPILYGQSPLVNTSAPLEQYSDFETMDKTIGDRVELTFVPMRNALFLTLAANRAVCLGIDDIITGVCQADGANYPDCRGAFLNAQELAINAALGLPAPNTASRMRIIAPLLNKLKEESIHFAVSVDGYYLLAFTHTSYDGHYPPTGKDHATVLRAHGFEESGLPDPLVVRAVMNGLMELPLTPNYQHQGENTYSYAEVARVVKMLSDMYGVGAD